MPIKNFIKISLLFSLALLFSGCWNIVGVEPSIVKGDEVNNTYLIAGIATLVAIFLIQVLFLKKTEAKQHFFEVFFTALFSILFSFTIIGAFTA